jgi:hypothetical protein
VGRGGCGDGLCGGRRGQWGSTKQLGCRDGDCLRWSEGGCRVGVDVCGADSGEGLGCRGDVGVGARAAASGDGGCWEVGRWEEAADVPCRVEASVGKDRGVSRSSGRRGYRGWSQALGRVSRVGCGPGGAELRHELIVFCCEENGRVRGYSGGGGGVCRSGGVGRIEEGCGGRAGSGGGG